MNKNLILLILFAINVNAETLQTTTYEISLTLNCEEGDVSCSDVSYVGKNKKTGDTLRLNGETLHSTCADGITPCRFLGYLFKDKDTTYYVYDNGLLEVVRGKDKVLLSEQGEWQY